MSEIERAAYLLAVLLLVVLVDVAFTLLDGRRQRLSNDRWKRNRETPNKT